MLAPLQTADHPILYQPKQTRQYVKAKRAVQKSKSLSYLNRAKSIEAQLNRRHTRSECPTIPPKVSRQWSLSDNDVSIGAPLRRDNRLPDRAKELKAPPKVTSPTRSPVRPPLEKIPVMRARGKSDAHNELRKYIATRKLQVLQEEAEKDGIKINIKYPMSSRRRSLSEGSVPLAVISEEPENEQQQRKRMNVLKRLWQKLRSRSRHSETHE